MPQFTGKIIQGKKIGIIPTDNHSEKELQSRVDKEYTFTICEKQSPYLRKKFWKLLKCASQLTEYIIEDITGRTEFANQKELELYIKDTLLIENGFSEPVLIVEGKKARLAQKAARTSTMNDETYTKMYAAVRDSIFDYCKKPRVIRVNGEYKHLDGLSDIIMFQLFGCLYLGFPMSDMEFVEEQIGLLDEQATIKYLQLAKMLQQPLTVEMFEAQQNKI